MLWINIVKKLENALTLCLIAHITVGMSLAQRNVSPNAKNVQVLLKNKK